MCRWKAVVRSRVCWFCYFLIIDFESSNMETPELVKKQHNAPAYLEKRKGRRKSTGFIHGKHFAFWFLFSSRSSCYRYLECQHIFSIFIGYDFELIAQVIHFKFKKNWFLELLWYYILCLFCLSYLQIWNWSHAKVTMIFIIWNIKLKWNFQMLSFNQ